MQSVLERNGILNPDESPEANDSAFITSTLEAVMEGLRLEEIAYWDDDAIPPLVFLPLGDLVWLYCAKGFGKPSLSGPALEMEEASIKRRIRRYTHKRSSGLDTYQDNF